VILPEEEGSFVHHMPNNYIGHKVLCKIDREELRNINKRKSDND
jgi:lipid A disaccharide synthetase